MLSNPNIYKKLHTIKAIERSIATGDRLDRSQDNKFQQGDRSDDTIDRIQGSNARTLRSKSYKQDNRSNPIGVAIGATTIASIASKGIRSIARSHRPEQDKDTTRVSVQEYKRRSPLRLYCCTIADTAIVSTESERSYRRKILYKRSTSATTRTKSQQDD